MKNLKKAQHMVTTKNITKRVIQVVSILFALIGLLGFFLFEEGGIENLLSEGIFLCIFIPSGFILSYYLLKYMEKRFPEIKVEDKNRTSLTWVEFGIIVGCTLGLPALANFYNHEVPLSKNCQSYNIEKKFEIPECLREREQLSYQR
jgi:uncharacterized membrane protein YkgB